MQKGQSFVVDVIMDQEQSLKGENSIHYLEVEWYEVFRSRIKRKTDQGLRLLIQKDRHGVFQDGTVLYSDRHATVLLRIRPCDCIVVEPESIHEMGRVCFEIGNKHIPIFLNESHEVSMAYDASIYQLLLGGNFHLRLENRVLHPNQMVRAYGNFYE